MDEITIYNPESQLRSPGRLIKSMWLGIISSRELVWRLVVRDISAQYRQSFLGMFWMLISPIGTTVTFVFLSSQNILNVGETDLPYPLYVMIGSTLWSLFTASMSVPSTAISLGQSMLGKTSTPIEALVITAWSKSLFSFAMQLVPITALAIYYHLSLQWTVVFVPFGILSIIILGTSIGFILSPLQNLYNDFGRVIAFVNRFWFFVTPVIYEPPEGRLYRIIDMVNPVSPLLTGTKELISQGMISEPVRVGVVSALAVVVFFLGWVSFRLSIPFLMERMNA